MCWACCLCVTLLIDCCIIRWGCLDSFSLVAAMLGCTCQVVRGFPAFAPCLEHICAGGGGGSVANMGFISLYQRGL